MHMSTSSFYRHHRERERERMPPKKNKQKQKPNSASSSSSSSKPKSQSSAPKLHISAENENRLRRLLLSSGRPPPSLPATDDALSKAQKAKKLKAVYEKLSCEGFSNDQIELALSSLKVYTESLYRNKYYDYDYSHISG